MINPKIIAWNLMHAVLMLAGLAAALAGYALLWGVLIILSFTLYFIRMYPEFSRLNPFYGPGNWLTALRLAGVIVLLLDSGHQPFVLIGWFAAGLVVFDVFDGLAARLSNTVSETGAWFDMETDALYVAVMGFIIYQSGIAPWWVLVPGVLRYLYILGVRAAKMSEKQETRSKTGKYIAGFIFISLPLPFLLSPAVSLPVLATACAAVMFSFARSVYMLKRKAR